MLEALLNKHRDEIDREDGNRRDKRRFSQVCEGVERGEVVELGEDLFGDFFFEVDR